MEPTPDLLPDGPLTYDDYAELPADGKRYEILDGAVPGALGRPRKDLRLAGSRPARCSGLYGDAGRASARAISTTREATMADANVPAAMPGWIQKHVKQYLESGGAEGHMWDSSVVGGPGPLPTLLLTTTGRKSGTKQLVPLIYGKTTGGVVVIASKGGAPEDPGWYRNLAANPAVEVQVGTDRFRATASTVEGPEREKLWKQLVAIYPPYVEYQGKTERKIPVVLLKRLG
jgi:proline iminopeptidase